MDGPRFAHFKSACAATIIYFCSTHLEYLFPRAASTTISTSERESPSLNFFRSDQSIAVPRGDDRYPDRDGREVYNVHRNFCTVTLATMKVLFADTFTTIQLTGYQLCTGIKYCIPSLCASLVDREEAAEKQGARKRGGTGGRWEGTTGNGEQRTSRRSEDSLEVRQFGTLLKILFLPSVIMAERILLHALRFHDVTGIPVLCLCSRT